MASRSQSIQNLAQRMLTRVAPALVKDIEAEARRSDITLTAQLQLGKEQAQIVLAGPDLLARQYGAPESPADYPITRILMASTNNRRRSP